MPPDPPVFAWDVLETKLYDTLLAVRAGDPPGDPGVPLGNVHRHKPEHEQSDGLTDYFLGEDDGEPVFRAWYVWVTPQLDFETHQSTTVRLNAEIAAFYAKGEQGEGAMLLKRHMSAVHQALRALDRNLGGACTLILDWSRYDAKSVASPEADDEGQIVTAGFVIACERINGIP